METYSLLQKHFGEILKEMQDAAHAEWQGHSVVVALVGEDGSSITVSNASESVLDAITDAITDAAAENSAE